MVVSKSKRPLFDSFHFLINTVFFHKFISFLVQSVLRADNLFWYSNWIQNMSSSKNVKHSNFTVQKIIKVPLKTRILILWPSAGIFFFFFFWVSTESWHIHGNTDQIIRQVISYTQLTKIILRQVHKWLTLILYKKLKKLWQLLFINRISFCLENHICWAPSLISPFNEYMWPSILYS